MTDLIWLLVGLGSIVLMPFVAVGVTVGALTRRVRRSRTLSGAALRTRARLSTGSQRKVLRLRVRLNETLLSGQSAMELAAQGESPAAICRDCSPASGKGRGARRAAAAA